jgi:hypothetical protein
MSDKIDKDTISRLIEEYKNSRHMADKVQARVDEFKKELTRLVKAHGIPDDRGHLWLPGLENQVKHERRVSKSFDLQSAKEWAKEIGIWDEVKEVVETTSEDQILKYVWSHPEHESTLASFYSEKESWAFKVVEQKSYDDE